MPFTPSHTAAVAVVWPFIRRIGIPFAAIVVGSMSPDFEFFFHLAPRQLFSHTLPGLVLFCLPAGLVVFAIWELLVRNPMGELVGITRVNTRPSTRWWMLAALGVLLGAVTHLLWDGVTHGGYWGAQLWPSLRRTAFTVGTTPVPWFNVLQHTSTVVGGFVVLTWLWRYIKRRGDLSLLWQTSWRRKAVFFIVVLAMLAAFANGLRGPFGADFASAQRLLGRIAVGGLLGLGLGVFAFSLRRLQVTDGLHAAGDI